MSDHWRYERGNPKDSKTVQEDEMQELRALHTKTKAELKEERDKVIELEDYTRRENLKFHNIPESEEEGVNHSPKQVILSILQQELQMDTAQIRFHAVHRGRLHNRGLCKSYTRWTKEANKGDVQGKGARFRGHSGW